MITVLGHLINVEGISPDLEKVRAVQDGARVGMDILSPLPISERENRYTVVVVDYATKRAEATALPVVGAKQVAEFFVHEILLRHGAPKKLTTD